MYSSYKTNSHSAETSDFVQYSLNSNDRKAHIVNQVFQSPQQSTQDDDAVVFYIQKTMTTAQIDRLVSHYAFELPATLEQFISGLAQYSDDSSAQKLQDLLGTFLQQPIDNHDIGLFGILDRLYFSWRLLEEANDYVTVYKHRSLLPWDMTEANLIMHQLLGANYAEVLDRVVIDIAENNVSKPLQLTNEKPSMTTQTYRQ